MSFVLIVLSFVIFDRENHLTLITSLIDVTSLIFCAKGYPIGQLLMVGFSLLYGLISFNFAYYGEMLIYLGMTMPMAVFSLISWLKNPYSENTKEIQVYTLNENEFKTMFKMAFIATFVFYFILKYFNTPNIIPSTVSVITSFIAVYLTYKRSVYFALGYAMNDLVLICLWLMAAMENQVYYSVVVCFVMFLINDIYGFLSWRKMEARQFTSS